MKYCYPQKIAKFAKMNFCKMNIKIAKINSPKTKFPQKVVLAKVSTFEVIDIDNT